MWIVWRSPQRSDLEAFGSFIAPILGAAVSLIIYLAKIRQPAEVGRARPVNEVTDLLAGAVREQWMGAATERRLLEPEPIPVQWERPYESVTGPLSAATGSRRFPPLPGLAVVKRRQLRNGGIKDLHALYGGLGSGRMVIIGAPGSGKSGAAVLLVLAALKHRERVSETERQLVPVPVLFTLHGWDPKTERVGDWLAMRLQETYPLFAGQTGTAEAAELVKAGRIAVILDGLDEVADDLRPVALRALNQQAAVRVIVLARSDEMAVAAKQSFLEGAIALELQAVDAPTAADYLTRVQLDPPPNGWRELTGRLRDQPGSPIAKALSNPLSLTLVRDTYRSGDDVREFLNFCDAIGDVSAEDIQDHLLDRVLPAAYTPQPGQARPEYGFREARHALGCIAAQMNQDAMRDLAWWGIPAYAPKIPRVIVTGLVFGLAFGLAGWLLTAFYPLGLALGFFLGLAGGLVAEMMIGRSRSVPQRVVQLQWRQLLNRSSLATGVMVVLVFGLILAPVLTVWIGPGSALVGAPGGGFVIGLGFAVLSGFRSGPSQPGAHDASPLLPRASWRRDQAHARTLGLVAGVTFWLGLWAVFAIAVAPLFGLAVGFVSGLAFGLILALTYPVTWTASLAFAQLARRWRTPLRLMRFLEEARELNILRTVGPVYQFRHARLQDRLARQASAAADPRP